MRPIIICPSMSLATRMTWRAATHFAKWYQERGVEPITLNGIWARKMVFLRVLRSVEKPVFVVYFGHGFEDSLVGSEPGARFGRRLVTTSGLRPINSRIITDLKDGIVVTLACLALNSLGPSLVEKGVGAFTGSRKPMRISRADVNNDGADDYIDLFTVIAKSLMLGSTVAQAILDFKTLGRHYASLCDDRSECPKDYAESMLINAEYYGFVGDGTRRVVAPSKEAAPPETPPQKSADVGSRRLRAPTVM